MPGTVFPSPCATCIRCLCLPAQADNHAKRNGTMSISLAEPGIAGNIVGTGEPRRSGGCERSVQCNRLCVGMIRHCACCECSDVCQAIARRRRAAAGAQEGGMVKAQQEHAVTSTQDRQPSTRWRFGPRWASLVCHPCAAGQTPTPNTISRQLTNRRTVGACHDRTDCDRCACRTFCAVLPASASVTISDVTSSLAPASRVRPSGRTRG